MSKTAAEWMADGIAFKNTKEMTKAAECFDKAIATDPNFGEAYYWKAFINADDTKLAEEVTLYEKAISLGYNQNHMVFYCMGVALGKLKRKEEAIVAYEKSSALNPDHFSSFNNKGNAQMVLGRVEDAIEAYRMSIKINPKRLDVYEGLGPLLEEIGQKEEALKAYDEGLQHDPNDLMVNLSKGTLLTEMGKYDDAIKCFEAALTKNKNAIVTNYRMGNALLASGREEEAKQHYTVTTKQNPTSSWGFCVRGQCFYRLGMKTEAFEDFKKTRDMFAKEEGLLNWTPKQVKFIKETLNSLLDSEDASAKAADIIETLNANNSNKPAVKNFISKMKKLQEDKEKAQSAVITQMAKRANDSVNTNLSELEKIREEFQRNMEEMKKEMSKIQDNVTNLETRVKTIEGNLEEMKEELNNKMDDFDKKIDVALSKLDLSPEDQKKLKGYYNAFVQTFACIHVTSQVVDSGQVQLDAGSSSTTLLSVFASFAPFVGNALSNGVISVGEFLQSQEMIKNARRIKSLAPDATRMSQLIGKSCFDILQDEKKRQMILQVTDRDLRQISGAMVQKILMFCDNIQEKVDSYLYTELYKTAAERVGHNDANMLVEKYINGEITPFDAQEQFVEEILKQAQDNTSKSKGEPMLTDLSTPAPSTQPRECCNMF